MPGLLPHIDPDGLLEYSVVYTDRVLNHMSKRFVGVMEDVLGTLKDVYGAESALVLSGSGTFGMEAVARQFATDRRVLIVRNGMFSYRWSAIIEIGRITTEEKTKVLMARPDGDDPQAPWAPPPLAEVQAAIAEHRPEVVFVPHVETSSGIILPDDYLRALAETVHGVGGLLVLDCIASGAIWVDMREIGVDVLVSAPQKGWSAPAGVAMIGLSAAALAALEETESTSFALNLKRWQSVMKTYEAGGHAYYATLPTMTLLALRDVMVESRDIGFELLRERQYDLGRKVRELMASRGFPSVAAAGFEAPGVVVSYTTDPDIKSGKRFAEHGIQVAGGVALMCGEPEGFSTFRLGLFGLEKLNDVNAAVMRLGRALDDMGFCG